MIRIIIIDKIIVNIDFFKFIYFLLMYSFLCWDDGRSSCVTTHYSIYLEFSDSISKLFVDILPPTNNNDIILY